MPISIVAPVNRSARIRKLHDDGLTPSDIAEILEVRLAVVTAALSRGPKDKPKSHLTVEARGPLTANEVARKTGMPLRDARLMVR